MNERVAGPACGGKSLTVVGAGNIGSHLLPLLARMPDVGRVLIVDRDVYEPRNAVSQDIEPSDVGRTKAVVQARRLRRIRPDLQADYRAEDVRGVPLGLLRADVILACLDSMGARQYVNRCAWRLGVPWIDAAVDGGDLLVRVNAYDPGGGGPCLECGFDEKTYDSLEQAYPCRGDHSGDAPATNGPAFLGSLAASLQAVECRKILDGKSDQALFGRQVLIDCRFHKHYLTVFRRNPRCRFDHRTWDIRRSVAAGEDLTLGGLMDEAREIVGEAPDTISVEGMPFATRLICPDCGRTRQKLYLADRLTGRHRRCSCGARMDAPGFDMLDRLDMSAMPSLVGRSARSVGLLAGDVISVSGPESRVHMEI